ncbi:universal stress protein [Candidatus Magnetaquicoccus inordinatus]|uniref:universal stress protein n=1 Tax=Candidatus Magnetaquicoccus inordinatus TaxID=2496818 RepID=UPI00102B2D2E|nr:universal stress protein [Candidatus Magnetaquicoccus inordinatus]
MAEIIATLRKAWLKFFNNFNIKASRENLLLPENLRGNPSPVIVLVDLFSRHSAVTHRAFYLAKELSADLIFVSLFEHLPDPPGQRLRTPAEHYRHIEEELLNLLQQHVRQFTERPIPCFVLSGPANDALAELAKSEGVNRIVTDLPGARVIHNHWLPCFQDLSRLPWQLDVVAEESLPW